jgi:hypothetical protein
MTAAKSKNAHPQGCVEPANAEVENKMVDQAMTKRAVRARGRNPRIYIG